MSEQPPTEGINPHLAASLTRVENVEGESFVTLNEREALELWAELQRRRSAILDYNELLRSAHSIAARQGDATNWQDFEKRTGACLDSHHATWRSMGETVEEMLHAGSSGGASDELAAELLADDALLQKAIALYATENRDGGPWIEQGRRTRIAYLRRARASSAEPSELHKVVRAHLEDLRGCVAAFDKYPEFANTSAQVRQAISELEAVLGTSPEPGGGQWQPIETRPQSLESAYLVTNGKQVAPWIRGVIHNAPGTTCDWEYGSYIIGWMPFPAPSYVPTKAAKP